MVNETGRRIQPGCMCCCSQLSPDVGPQASKFVVELQQVVPLNNCSLLIQLFRAVILGRTPVSYCARGMGSSDEEGRALGTAEYWNERYAKSDGVHPTHEWFKSFDALETFFAKHLFAQRSVSSKILHLGSGDSTIPRSFAVRGYHNQLCVDFSAKVVEVMRAQDVDMPGIEWQQANVRDMANVGTQSIDVAFDKGTLDAMIYGSPWDPPEDVRSNTTKYIDEVSWKG